MTAAWNVNNLYSRGLLGFVFVLKILPPPNRPTEFQQFKCAMSKRARYAYEHRALNLSFGQLLLLLLLLLFFLHVYVCVIFRLNCNSQNRISFVCWWRRRWCAAIALDVESAEKMDFIPFQYETISLYRICLTAPSVRSQKHFWNFGCTYAKKLYRQTLTLLCMSAHSCMRMGKKNTEAVLLISLLFSTAANVKLLFA